MSTRTKAIHSAVAAAHAAGGSHLTREAREITMRRVIDAAWERGQQVLGIANLREKHIAAYVLERLEIETSKRSVQNELAHIRASLRAVGRHQAADSPGISCKALGVAGSSRDGTNKAATAAQVERAYAAMAARDPGLAAMVRLSRELGLRRMEAIQCADSLRTWEHQLAKGKCRVEVIFGTKGGRPRHSLPADRERALAAVREARAVIKKRGGGDLLPGRLKQAMNLANNAMTKSKELHGITWHSLRYAYTGDRVADYSADVYSRREVYALASADLGHGDGRGRYVERVYMAGSEEASA